MNTHITPTTSASIIAHQLGFLPAVERFTHRDSTPCVRVALGGLHGAGRTMTMDETDWRHISETISPWWQVQKMSGVEYVVASSGKAAEIAKQSGRCTTLFLARHLMQPGAGLNVRFRNNDRLDLRRSNLVVVDPRGSLTRQRSLAS